MAVEEKELPDLGFSIPGSKGTPKKSKTKEKIIFAAVFTTSILFSYIVLRLSLSLFIILEAIIFILWMILAIWVIGPHRVTVVPGGSWNVKEGSWEILLCLLIAIVFTAVPLLGIKYYKYL